MTVGAQRSHAEWVGQAQGEPVTLFSNLELDRVAPRVNLTVEPECPRLVATLATPASDAKRLIGKPERVRDPAGEQICLTEPGRDHRGTRSSASCQTNPRAPPHC